MERISCNLCGRDDSQIFIKRTDRLTGEQFEIQRCRNCGLVYVNPRPTLAEIASYYPNHYEPYIPAKPQNTLMAWRAKRGEDIKRRFIERHHPPGRLLDLGCATGDFMAHMASCGWQVQGVETSSLAAEYAREQRGLTVFNGHLPKAGIADASLDVITMWDVLEHLYQPKEELAYMHQLLADDGLLVFTIPNLDSWDRKIFGDDWIGWDVPRHLYGFPRKTLERLVTKAGFQIIARKCFTGGIGAFGLSLALWIKQRKANHLNTLSKAILPLLPLILWPYKELAYRMGRGPVETFACIKR